VESLDVYHETEKRLNYTDGQYGDVTAAFPEAPAEARDDGARDNENQEEADDVIPVSECSAPDRSRCKEMPEEA